MAKTKKLSKTKDYQEFLLKQLQDSDLAAEYLSSAIQDGNIEEFLIALKNVAEAHGGIGLIAKMTKLNRQSMYKMFSEDGNPTISSLLLVLKAIGINVTFASHTKNSNKKAA